MPIQKKYMLPMAFVLMGTFSIAHLKTDLSPNVQRVIASDVSEDIEKQESSLPKKELERLSQLAVDIDQAKKDISELENQKSYIQEMLEKDSLNEEDIKELGQALTSAEEDLIKNSEKLTQLKEAHQKEMDHLIDVYEKQKEEIEKLSAHESQDELDKKVAELESLKEAMDKLKNDLDGSQTDNKNLKGELEEARIQVDAFRENEKDLKAAYCQQKDKVSELEDEISELLKDKEAVAQKIVEIAEDKDKLNSKVDELRDEVAPKKEKKEDESNKLADGEFDVTAIMGALTNLTKQLELNSQMLAMQSAQMPSISSYFQRLNPGAQAMNQYHGFNTSAFQGPFSGPKMSHPFGNFSDFHNDYSFPMTRAYGSDLIGQPSSMPNFDFGSVRQSFQTRNPSAQGQQAGSVFFDFNNAQ